MGYKTWSNESVGSYAGRGLYKNGTSGGADLFAPDASIITVARGTTLVYMETLTAGMSGDYLGLRNSPSGSRNTWISTGLYSYQSYYVADLGGGPGGTFNGTYGGNTCTAIFTMESYPNQSQIYGHAEGSCQRNGDGSQDFEARYVKTSSGLETWASITDVHGYTYAAITLNTDSYNGWYHYSYLFYGGFTYNITLQVYCPTNAYEGIAVFNTTKSNNQTSTQIKNLSGVLYYCQANENGGYKNFDYTPSSNTTLHFYFRRNGDVITSNYWRRAYIKIVMKNNVVVYGNGNGDSTTTYKIAPYVANSGVIITPKTRTGSNGIAYTFKGFFTSSAGGDSRFDSTGKIVDKDKILYSNGSYYYNVYAGWGNTISYSPYTTTVGTYCTTAASVANSATGNVSVKVAAEPAKCASGETLSVSVSPNYRWPTINSDAQYLTVSNGLAGGQTYGGPNVYISSKSGSNYQSMELSKSLPSIRLSKVAVTTYGTPTTPTITQTRNIYPSVYSINSNNVTTFFSGKNSTQTITYTNGATRNGSITYEWGGSKTLDLGMTYMPSSSTVNFNNSVYVCAKGENSIYSSKAYISTATVASNVITNLYLLEPYNQESSQPDDLYWADPNSSQRLFLIVARYTSGEEREILNNNGNLHYSYYASPSDMLSMVMISWY